MMYLDGLQLHSFQTFEVRFLLGELAAVTHFSLTLPELSDGFFLPIAFDGIISVLIYFAYRLK